MICALRMPLKNARKRLVRAVFACPQSGLEPIREHTARIRNLVCAFVLEPKKPERTGKEDDTQLNGGVKTTSGGRASRPGCVVPAVRSITHRLPGRRSTVLVGANNRRRWCLSHCRKTTRTCFNLLQSQLLLVQLGAQDHQA